LTYIANMITSLEKKSGWELMKRFGTSYFWATLLLPHDVQQATVELYKFVRIPDQIVDTAVLPLDKGAVRRTGDSQEEELETLYQDRQQAYQSCNSSHPIFGQWVGLMGKYEIDPDLVDSFYQAMRDDLTVKRYETYEQLQWYMYGSAEVVWLMMCDLIWYDQTHQQVTLEWARKLGEAMQLTNFLRDIYEDYVDLDRIYMPSNDLAQFGLSHEDIIQFCQSKQIDDRRAGFMKYMVDRCDQLYDQANATIHYLNPSCQSAIILSSDLYREILRKIESIWYNQFAHSARTSKRDKLKVITKRQVLCKFSVQYCSTLLSK
jgi:15-cis-phytoene synthase